MGRQQKCPVRLTDEEREQLRSITRTGKNSARGMQRAQILLWSDEGKQDKEIVALLGCVPLTVASVRERWVKEKRLDDLPRLGSKPMLDAKQESLLIALACIDAPEGRDEWTMQLLADKLVELKVVERISGETVRRTLKKQAQAVAKRAVVHPAGRCRIRLADGGCVALVRRTLQTVATSALTSVRVNWWVMYSNRCRASQAAPSEWITNTNGMACAMRSCCFNR